MYEVLCELCLATHGVGDTGVPKRCPACGGRRSLIGPYPRQARIRSGVPEDVVYYPAELILAQPAGVFDKAA